MASRQPPSASPSSRRRTTSRDSAQPRAVVGQWTVIKEIGRGSFATVYQGMHTKERTVVAIKSVHTAKLNRKLRENLSSEIGILKYLYHPHIVALIECHEAASHINLVMEFCSMGDLSVFIKKRDRLADNPVTASMMRKYPSVPRGGLNEVIVRHFLKQLSSALEFLRGKNLIHRDVKPQNLLIHPSPHMLARLAQDLVPYAISESSLIPTAGMESLPMLKVADFGFARSLPATSLAETLCGSPLYMAPEILRYEKYDAKADLWSVGSVLHEMITGKPPFRAGNHVELLRTIELQEDRIRFPSDSVVSEDLKHLIRGLLKRSPVERMDFPVFFQHPAITSAIPGLVEEDLPQAPDPAPTDRELPSRPQSRQQPPQRRLSNDPRERRPSFGGEKRTDDRLALMSAAQGSTGGDKNVAAKLRSSPLTRIETQAAGPTPGVPGADAKRNLSGGNMAYAASPTSRYSQEREQTPPLRRPTLGSTATAPAFTRYTPPNPASAAMERQTSRNSASPPSSLLAPRRHDERTAREIRERAEQDVAFERDYVVVEKRAVEVNSLADELAASPRLQRVVPHSLPNRPSIQRPATTQAVPQTALAAPAKRIPDSIHYRKTSFDLRYGISPSTAASALTKALNGASHRLLGIGFSPPLLGRLGGPSPPQSYGAFPAYPATAGSLVVVGEGAKSTRVLDDDSRAVVAIEECATRSDVVFGFAEVKYKQLIPLAPSSEQQRLGLGLRIERSAVPPDPTAHDDGLTIGATVTLSEEALVLYVKALSLLAKCMDIAGAWWAQKNRGEDTSPSRDASTSVPGNRINLIVQWVRNRFNEVLEKAEFVRLKLLDAQKQLPEDHPCHPSNHPVSSLSTGLGKSADGVFLTPGVSAEKLMYDRAVEMSRAAALNELVGEDLSECEIAYITAIRMLEAVLEHDDDMLAKKGSSIELNTKNSKSDDGGVGTGSVNGVEAEDRKVLVNLVAGIRGRLSALRKKLALISKRHSIPLGKSTSARGAAHAHAHHPGHAH
ncbi:MAG: Serine/threonine-protein kinase [Trizodia sp. TS-e1964]|nr:MAG: Serine/threonine-protein kinase [Trizodia sp. TS-e1964]